jgi:eukaryotic-like serine/threonine-protein kinase
MTDAAVRDKLARISARPAIEWERRLEQEFPGDPAMRMQALLWLHAEKEGPELEGSAPSLGEAADERYELSLRLDLGSTSSVWQAFDRRLGRSVAIKVFRERDRSEALDQVLAEARAASDVVSEHVVRVLDVQYGDGHPYIVMELVSEYDADKGEVVLGTTAAATKPSSIDEVARWVKQVARGVHEAHLRNEFHRDLKPKNVLVTPNSRRARVADFGLAVSGSSPDTAHPTVTLLKRGPSGPVSVRGTPEYMAPEQARGLPLTLDPRSADDRAVLVAIDVWGLGAIAYDLVLGRPPWLARKADDLSAWEIAASTEVPPPVERTRDNDRVPRRLRRIIEKAMAIDPKQRYTSAAELANELDDYLSQRPTSLDRSRFVRLGLWSRRNPQLALTILLAFGLTALAAGTHLTVTRLQDERAALDERLAAQKREAEQLNAAVGEARAQLQDTRVKLGAERASLDTLEKSIADERAAYVTLIDAKEQALRDATRSTRRIMEQLEAARRERRIAEDAKANLEKIVGDLRRDGEQRAKEREKLRRERDAARAERDTSQRERDAAIAEQDATERQLHRLRAELDRAASARNSRR